MHTTAEMMAAFRCTQCGAVRAYGHGTAETWTPTINCSECARPTTHTYLGQRLFAIDMTWDSTMEKLKATRFYLAPLAEEEA